MGKTFPTVDFAFFVSGFVYIIAIMSIIPCEGNLGRGLLQVISANFGSEPRSWIVKVAEECRNNGKDPYTKKFSDLQPNQLLVIEFLTLS